MKRYIISLLLAAAFISCSDELTMNPAVSFFAESPEVTDETAIFRLATAFMTDSTERVFPVTFGGTAEKGVDYTASADAFVLGGDSPVDSIIVTTLKFGTEKTVSLTVSLPEGTDGGKYLTSEFTIQDNPAYFTFERDFGILTDSVSIAFTVTDKNGKKKALMHDVRISITADPGKSTAYEGTDFTFADSTFFTIKAGETKGEIKLIRPDSAPAEDRGMAFFNISHDDIYGDGEIAEMGLHLMERKWGKLDGRWKMDTLVTDSLYMADYWGEQYSKMDQFPKQNDFDAMEFDLSECEFKPSFFSRFENYFIDRSDFRTGEKMLLDLGNGSSTEIQTFILDNTNRYFSARETSEDTESYIGLRLLEGSEEAADTLDMYIIDYVSRSFMPELESEGKYAPEKPVAASPGLYLNVRFTKNQ